MSTRPAAADASRPAADRAPLSAAAVRGLLVRRGARWCDVRVVAETGSTNADVLAEARNGAQEGMVLAAESQTAGRGRLGRRWASPPLAALTFSVLLRPSGVPPGARGWVPLLAGVAVASALRAEAGVDARLKWPNDVLVDGAKVAGILAEQAGDAIVVGAGINVSTRQDELPAAGATSLALAGSACTDREHLLACVLAGLERRYLAWTGAMRLQDPAGQDSAGQGRVGQDSAGQDRASQDNAGQDSAGQDSAGQDSAGQGPAGHGRAAQRVAGAAGLRAEYLRLSATAGRPVRVSLPGGTELTGTAQDVDEAGRLVIRAATGLVAVSAGDVVHLR